MRNCLFNGPATQWLKKASNSPEFLSASGRSLDSKSMRDREAINRFCAFYLIGEDKYSGGDMDAFLARALEKMQNTDLDHLYSTFIYSMQVNRDLFGEHAFRKSLAHCDAHATRTVLNIALFDVCSVLLANIDEDIVKNNMETLHKIFASLIQDENFSHAITYSTNSTRQVRKRFEMARSAIKKVLNV